MLGSYVVIAMCSCAWSARCTLGTCTLRTAKIPDLAVATRLVVRRDRSLAARYVPTRTQILLNEQGLKTRFKRLQRCLQLE